MFFSFQYWYLVLQLAPKGMEECLDTGKFKCLEKT